MLLSHARAGSQVQWNTAAELQGERVFGFVVTQEAFVVAVEKRASGDHFGVEQGVF
ncbi:hypothetical protein D3C71_823810 [compost metagenome]